MCPVLYERHHIAISTCFNDVGDDDVDEGDSDDDGDALMVHVLRVSRATPYAYVYARQTTKMLLDFLVHTHMATIPSAGQQPSPSA